MKNDELVVGQIGGGMTKALVRPDLEKIMSKNNSGVIFMDAKGELQNDLICLGEKGVGMSANYKAQLLKIAMNGENVILIDPEQEYAEISKSIGNRLQSPGIINPLKL